MKTVVTGKALREMVQEALWNNEYAGWSSNHGEPVVVNSDVDPSVSVTDPVNPNFTPQDKTEFAVAVNQLVKNVPDDKMPSLYAAVKAAIDDSDKENEDDMKTKADLEEAKLVEEAIRKAVRRLIAEADLPPVKKIPPGVHGAEYQRQVDKHRAWLKRNMGKAIDAYEKSPPVSAPEADATGAEKAAPEIGKKKTYKATALGDMADVNGASFEQIAKELGFSIAGAKQAVDKALEKAQFLAVNMDDDDREILVLTAMNDYIKHLTKSGELSAADVQLMKDHPDIVRDLDGFREFLHNTIRAARKGAKLIDPLKDDDDDVSTLELDDVEGAEDEPAAAEQAPQSWELEDVGDEKPETFGDLDLEDVPDPDKPVGEGLQRPVLRLR